MGAGRPLATDLVVLAGAVLSGAFVDRAGLTLVAGAVAGFPFVTGFAWVAASLMPPLTSGFPTTEGLAVARPGSARLGAGEGEVASDCRVGLTGAGAGIGGAADGG